MKQSKESNRYFSLIIILSVLLIVSLITGVTFAWFSSSDNGQGTIKLGDPVVVNIVGNSDGTILADGAQLPFAISTEKLMSGTTIETYASVKFQQSQTPALLRVKLYVTIVGGTATVEETNNIINLINQQVYEKATFNGEVYPWMYDESSGWWYYTNGQNDTENVKNSLVETINCEDSPVIDFLNPENNQVIVIPGEVDNKFAGAKVTFWFSVQAIQARIPADINDDTIIDDYLVTTIGNVESIFDEAFADSND